MDLFIRRSPIVTKAESEETLAETINVSDVHMLLYQRGEIALADLLTAHLLPREAVALAQDLRHFVRQATRHRLWRDYRTRLDPTAARAIGLAAAWYERAGAAGCRTWADLRQGTMPTGIPCDPRSEPLRLLPSEATGRPSATDATPRGLAGSSTDDAEGDGGIMPTWLQAPKSSVWDQ